MNCQEAQGLIHGYVDGELDVVRAVEFEKHLSDCEDCKRRVSTLKALGGRVRELYANPPDSVRAAVLSKLNKQEHPRARLSINRQRIFAIAASVLLLVAAAYIVARMATSSSSNDLLAQEVVSSHVRSLMATHLMDVPSSDQHTVKPWFAGRLDFSPVVKDLSSDGFSLIGGRLDYVDGRPVAALVFQRRQHYINLFTWPTDGGRDKDPRRETRQGYNIVNWTRSQAIYWAVSDLNGDELMGFARAYSR
jgi:anti-sigma factor RsiW